MALLVVLEAVGQAPELVVLGHRGRAILAAWGLPLVGMAAAEAAQEVLALTGQTFLAAVMVALVRHQISPVLI
jgi:hypothetical protein